MKINKSAPGDEVPQTQTRICFLCFVKANVINGACCTYSGQPSPMVTIPDMFQVIGDANAERKKGTAINEERVKALTKALRILQGLEESETGTGKPEIGDTT